MFRGGPGSGGRQRPAGLSKPFTSPVISSKATVPAMNRCVAPRCNVVSDKHQMPPPSSTSVSRQQSQNQPQRSQQPSSRQQPQVASQNQQQGGTSNKANVDNHRRRVSAVNADVQPPLGVWQKESKVGRALFECGLALYSGQNAELYVEGSLFRREFAKRLQSENNANRPAALISVTEVVDFIDDFISDRGRFLNALMPSFMRKDDEDGISDEIQTFLEQQQSVMRLLLGIDELQQAIADRLMEKLVDVADPINPADRHHPATVGVDMPFLIVSQFKWLENIFDPEQMIGLFLGTIKFDDHRAISHELISALPEIFGDAQHAAIVDHLRPLFDNPRCNYLADALDTFANLSLDPPTVEQLQQEITEMLGSMSVESIPAALKFILSTVTAENAAEVLDRLREKLDIDDEDFVATYSNEQKQSLFKLIYGELKSALLLNGCQLNGWTKMYAQQPPAGTPDEILHANYEIRPFDLTMLVILHSVSFKKKVIENVLRTRRRAGLVSDKTIKSAFQRYHEVFGDHLRSVVAIADSCVRFSDITICSFGRLVYIQAFCEFDNVCIRQDIVANLVTHVFSLPISSTNCAMDILLALSEECPHLLVRFRVFVRNMLDVLDNLHLSDVRKLYRILANMAFAISLSNIERTRFKDDLYLIIRKQLAFSGPENAKYRAFGVLAAAMLARGIGQWAKKNPNATFSDSNTTAGASTSSVMPESEISREIKQLFHLVQNSVLSSKDLLKAKDVTSLGLFYDELSILVSSGYLPIETIEWLSEILPQTFSTQFLRAGGSDRPSVKIAGLYYDENSFSLVQDAENYAKLMLFDTTVVGILANNKGSDIFRLCPLYRLLSYCYALLNEGSLNGLMGQLVCSINFPTLRSLRRLRRSQTLTLTEQYAVCEALLALVNWFRELLSIFGCVAEAETRGYCLRRLHDLVEATIELEEFSKSCPSWVPLAVSSSVFLAAGSKSKQHGRPASKLKTKKDGKGKKPKLPTSTQAKSQAGLPSQHLGATQTQGTAKPSGGVTTNFTVMARFRPAFRELSLVALQALQGDLPSDEQPPSDSLGNTNGASVLQMSLSSANSSFTTIFTPQEALYLVEDLIDKLRYSFLKAGSKAFGNFASSGQLGQASEIINRSLDEHSLDEILEHTLNLVGSLCSLLQGCYAMLTEVLSESDGTIERIEERAEWAAGLRLYGCIFDCLAMLLNNVAQLRPDLIGRLVFAIANSGAALQAKDDVRTPAGDNVFEAFQWLARFSDALPTLQITGAYLRTMEALFCLCKRGPNRGKLTSKLHDICQTLMENDWTDAETKEGTASGKVIHRVFQAYLIHGEERLADELQSFLYVVKSELTAPGTGPEAKSVKFRMLTKKTFPMFYEVMMTQLVRLAQTTPSLNRDGMLSSSQQQQQMARSQHQFGVDAGMLTQRHHIIPDESAAGHREMVTAWDELGTLFRDSVEMTKTFSSRSCLISALKHGRTFLEIFLKRAMPLLDLVFQGQSVDVKELLSAVQKGTRTLQTICSESKSHKDVSVIALVPRTKKTLESFILRVKQMLYVNNCMANFDFGTLKCRNIRGEEISSQNPYNQEDDEKEEDQQPPKKSRKREKGMGKKASQQSSSQATAATSEYSTAEEDEDESGDGDEATTDDESDGVHEVDDEDSNDEEEQDECEEEIEEEFGESSYVNRRTSTAKKRTSYSTAYDGTTIFDFELDEDDEDDGY